MSVTRYCPREDLTEAVCTLALPYGERAGWSRQAVATYVREKLAAMPEFDVIVSAATSTKAERARARAQWAIDNICCAILNESFGP